MPRKYFFNIEKIIDVPKEAFNPSPRVTSCLVRLTPKKELTKTEEIFQNMCYNNRKTICRSYFSE